MADLSDVKLEMVDTVDKAFAMMRWLGERRPTQTLGVDIETGEFPGRDKKDALSPWHGRVRLAQIGDGQTGWAVPWEKWRGVYEEALNKWEGDILIHNSGFDVKWLMMHSDIKIPWHRLHDSMIASRIVSPLESAALKRLTSKYVDPRAAALQTMLDDKMRDNGWSWGTVPIDLKEYWCYGALDTVLAVRMWEKLGVDVIKGGQFSEVYDMEMAVRRICTMMEINGARVDLDYSKEKYDELNNHFNAVSEWVADQYSGANIASTKQMATVFEKTLGAEITEFTPGGSPKVDKVQLQKFSRDFAGAPVGILADAILAARKSSKLASSYFNNILTMEIDGVLHPQINTLAARTSRMSIQDPALQTLPKRDKVVRKAFIPRNEDEIIMSCDLEQVEARVFSCLSEDRGLIDLFKFCDSSGEDFFTQILREVYKDPTADKTDPKRQLIKNMMYGRLYGAGISKMALTAGVPDVEMKEVNDSFDFRFPGMKTLMKQVEHMGMSRLRTEGVAYVFTKMGRKLPADDERVYSLVNYLIQGSSAEILKNNILRCDAAGLTDYLIVPVHDELVLSVPKSDQDEIGRILQECMTTRDGWEVPLLAGAPEVGERWGELG